MTKRLADRPPKRLADRPPPMFVDEITRNAIVFVGAVIRLATLPMCLLERIEQNEREEDPKP